MPIREIARRTGLSRNTVRRYLADGELEPKYSKRNASSKLDAYEQTLTSWLHREANRDRKERRTVKQLYHDLIPLGYTGSYDRVAAFARQWRQSCKDKERASHGAFIPLTFAPGEAFQFDWSEEWIVIAGHKTKVQIAHFKLCHSRAFFLRAYLQQTQEMLFDAHNHAFSFFGGVPDRGIYDNMRTAVDKVGRGKHRTVNARFQAMVGHFYFEAEFCNPASGWEKGQVEKNVRDTRGRILSRASGFESLGHFNLWLMDQCRQAWATTHHPERKPLTVEAVWEEERASLMAIPSFFDAFVEHPKRVSPTSLVTFDHTRYSVPAAYVGRPISLRVYAERLVMVADDQVIATHDRIIDRKHQTPGQTVYDWTHYLSVLQRKPGALRNGAPFAELPEVFKELQALLLNRPGGDREMVDILALVLHHDEAHVEAAVREALHHGFASKQHVVNCLMRRLAPSIASVEGVACDVKLIHEPKANTGRYDDLREVHHAP